MGEFKDLEGLDEKLDIPDFETTPDERGGGLRPNIPVGIYVFQLPHNLKHLWDTVPAVTTGDYQRGPRVALNLNTEGLIIRAAPPKYQRLVNELWFGRISNVERNRARKGDPPVKVSEMAYLLRALGVIKTPKTNGEFVEAMNAQAGKLFQAKNTWSAYSSATKTRYVRDADGRVIQDPDGGLGTGANFYEKDIPKDPETGELIEEWDLQDGTVVRAFQQLEQFKVAPAGVEG